MEIQNHEKEKQHEETMSSALIHDIIDRHFFAEGGVARREFTCGFCKKTILSGKTAIFIPNFERKFKIAVCDKDCCDAHEYSEMQFFGCSELENMSRIVGKTKSIRRYDLIRVYNERLDVQRQNHIDMVVAMRGENHSEAI